MPRKGFNFYRSYFDVYLELTNDVDKLSYIDALLKKQFLGIDPDLKGMAKFAYISQQHSINQQVKGWEDKTGETLISTPSKGGTEGGFRNPSEQEKEKEKEKEQSKIPPIESVINFFIENGYSKEAAIKAFNYYEQGRIDRGGKVWKDSKGNTVKSWKQKMRGVWFKDENKIKSSKSWV